MSHHIKTPKGFSQSGPHGMETFEFNPGFGQKYTDSFNAAQQGIDEDVIRYNSPYVPFDTGMLDKSGLISTVVGSGEVVYKTPYARRMYYNPQYNFQGAPMRGAYFFERMKVDHKDDILRNARKVFKK